MAMISETPIRVLLIEGCSQTSHLAEVMLRLVSQQPLQVDFVTTLAEAVSKKSTDYSAVLLDLNLPDSQGLETLKQTRLAYPWLPIIVVTDNGDERWQLETIKNGAQDFLVKCEVTPHTLVRSLLFAIERNDRLFGRSQRLESVNTLLDVAGRLAQACALPGQTSSFKT